MDVDDAPAGKDASLPAVGNKDNCPPTLPPDDSLEDDDETVAGAAPPPLFLFFLQQWVKIRIEKGGSCLLCSHYICQ